MSVIIRLQNLPWAANAADIRVYFAGLSIPEGGVHIVGGEKGDAFISFSTDEDARQAMLSDGGCIKDVQVRLLLSSRNEMQKVIDAARQQTLYNVYMQQNSMQQNSMQQNSMQQPQIAVVGALPLLTAKVLPQPQQQQQQPQQQPRLDQLGPQMMHRPQLMDAMSVHMPQDKQQLMQPQHLSPKSSENRDRDHKRERSRSKSRERRSKSSRSGGGGRRDRSRSRDRRRRDRSRGRNRSRDRYRGGDGRNSTSRGSSGKPQRSHSPVSNIPTDGVPGKFVGDQQAPMNPWSCQYNNMQQQQVSMGVVDNRQPTMMANNIVHSGIGGSMFGQFRTPPQPPIVPVILPPNSFHHQQQQQQQQQKQQQQQQPKPHPPPLMNMWPSGGGNHLQQPQQQQPYVPDNDFRADVYGGGGGGGGGGGSDDEDDRQAEFDNNFQGRFNENAAPAMRRGPPGQDFREQRGYGSNRGGPNRFHKPQQSVPPVVGQHGRGGGGSQRPFDEFGNGAGGGPRFNHQQQQPRYGGQNISDGGGRGGRPSRFSSINENGKPSKFNQVQQPGQQPRRDNDNERSGNFDESSNKRMPPRYNDRYRYDVRNAQVPHSEGLCVEVNNMCSQFSYGDIRKLFDGIHIDGSAIKIQKHRHGVAFVRFDNNHNKNLAMKKNGTVYKGNHVVVKHLDDGAYERDNTDDRPYPTMTAPNIVDHVDLVDDDDDDDDNDEEEDVAAASDKPAVADKKKPQNKTSKAEDEGSGGDDDGGNLVECSDKGAVPAEGGAGDEQRKDPPTKYLKLKQLPLTVAEEDVLNEFDGSGDVRRVTFYPDGEFMGAVLEFVSTEAAESTFKQYDCVLLGSTPVPVLRCSFKEYAQIKRKSGGGSNRFSSDSGGRHHHGHHHHTNSHQQQAHAPAALSSSPVPPPPPPNVSSGTAPIRSNCLFVYGLPTSVTNTDITQFFSDASVLPDKIHIMLSKFGRPTGESYCEFGNAQQAAAAMVKDQCYMGPNLVCVEPINRSFMIQAITKPMQLQHYNQSQDMSWSGPGMRGGGGGGGGGGPQSRQQHQRPPYGGGGGGGGHNGPYNRPQQQFMNQGGGGGRGGYTPRIRGPGPGPNTGPDGFGQPGCVVALDNVPYRADVQGIVDFFEGFDLNSQNVIRRFNDFGKPTGEARVNLRNPQEASRAVRVLQNKPIYNRPVRLTLL